MQSAQGSITATKNGEPAPENVVLRRVYRYRLYPTKTQERKLLEQLELSRRVYNKALWWREGAWQREGRRVTRREQIHALVQLKQDYPQYVELSPGILVDVIKRVDLAFKAFFRRVQAGEQPGHPRAKGLGWYKSITIPRRREFKLKYSPGEWYGYLSFKGFSNIRLRMHRRIPAGATVRRVIVKRESTGQWYVMLGWDRENFHPPEHPHKDAAVGLHPGLSPYLSTDTGETFQPHLLSAAPQEIGKVPTRPGTLEEGIKAPGEAADPRCQATRQDCNARHAFQHHLSCKLVARYGKLFINRLEIRQMLVSCWRS